MDFSALFDDFGQLTATGFTQGAIYALVALGYTLVYGVLRLINFAHSEVFVTGTFAAILTLRLVGVGADEAVPGTVMVIVALAAATVAAMAASGATALVVERVAYRPLRKRNAPPLVFLISAIGASIAISEAFGVFYSRDNVPVGNLIQPSTQFEIFGASITNQMILVVVAAFGVMILLDTIIRRTRLGRGIRAVAQDPDAAALMGVNKDRVIAWTFVLGGLMAGVAAVLYDLQFGVTKFNAGFLLGLKAFTAAVLGGIGNLRGALLGGLLLGLIENWGQAVIGSSWRDVIAFVFLILVLMFRPTGLLGESLGRARA
ncbi:branched-chain amino acid ABC transporter permease [Cryptosporangium aurantiacum]|uniref:Amino acid/amide ABC transporter membrane protein 1, HAAT family n=1 Tax=Cryptosporangium aurantiacum TaxID=134849 RepID=A0A1M7ICC9_9ACTN|nr:branched-chain amino acid ABC transporter permease [Cryptosporangium aurantiacum]SHM38335.1 amino acid/amide ABC transporter membrane protein 1, HAAT family [Cryptosporangium aurantiacum]